MIDFIIKSTISLGILYLFYLLFLRRLKSFNFNRYFLLGSIVFSLLIPFLSVPVNNSSLPLIQATGNLAISRSIKYSGEFIESTGDAQILHVNFLVYIYAAISLILFFRFAINLLNMLKSIRDNQKVKYKEFTLVLHQKQGLPHSFFNCVFINDAQYRSGNIDDALVHHEITHCQQGHSFDIVFIELIKVVLWINPFIWLLKVQIQLNHEYLADSSVLLNHDINRYKKLLISIVLNNNSGILISNFNFSFTKQRLKMMTRKFHPKYARVSKIAAICTMLLVGIMISCTEDPIEQNVLVNTIEQNINLDTEHDWWQPILKQHNIQPVAYNNFPYVFEMGAENSITDGIVTLKDAYLLLKITDGYSILKSPLVYHNLNSNTISADFATIDSYHILGNEGRFNSKFVNHQYFENLKMQMGDKVRWKADKMESFPIQQKLGY